MIGTIVMISSHARTRAPKSNSAEWLHGSARNSEQLRVPPQVSEDAREITECDRPCPAQVTRKGVGFTRLTHQCNARRRSDRQNAPSDTAGERNQQPLTV